MERLIICCVCGKEFLGYPRRTCCSISCRGKKARSLQPGIGRSPIHGGCVGGKLEPEYKIWAGIIRRCHQPKSNKYSTYGARGISVCDQWRESYTEFKNWANQNGFSKGLQIDRINNSLGYSPENCRFVTPKQNCLNRDRAIRFGNLSSQDVADNLGMSKQAIWYRVKVLGINPEIAARTPKQLGGKWQDEPARFNGMEQPNHKNPANPDSMR